MHLSEPSVRPGSHSPLHPVQTCCSCGGCHRSSPPENEWGGCATQRRSTISSLTTWGGTTPRLPCGGDSSEGLVMRHRPTLGSQDARERMKPLLTDLERAPRYIKCRKHMYVHGLLLEFCVKKEWGGRRQLFVCSIRWRISRGIHEELLTPAVFPSVEPRQCIMF